MKQDGGHLFCRQFSQVSLCPSPVSSTRLNPVQTSYASPGYLLHRIPSSLVQLSTGGKTYFTMLGLNVFWVVLIVMSKWAMTIFPTKWPANEQVGGWAPTSICCQTQPKGEFFLQRDLDILSCSFPDLRASLCGLFWFFFGTLPKTNSLHLALVSFSKGNSSEPTPVFQVRFVSFREGNPFIGKWALKNKSSIVTFHCTGWCIGILITVFYMLNNPRITAIPFPKTTKQFHYQNHFLAEHSSPISSPSNMEKS